MSRVWEVREVPQFIGAGRPPDLAKSVRLNDDQWQAWLRLQKGALRFGSAFLADMQRTNEGKDRFFIEAMSFVHAFAAPVSPPRPTRKRKVRR